MNDATVKKIDSRFSPQGSRGQIYLVSGTSLALRLWRLEPGKPPSEPDRREYETVGYVIDGRAELLSEGQTIMLEPGDSWLVPQGASHTYRILEPFTAVEATHPPARLHDRDAP